MKNKVLIIGIGNNSRSDDGLGWKFLQTIPGDTEDIDLEYRYQLQIEDADYISPYGTVIFVDATKKKIPEGFYFSPCHPKPFQNSFTTHSLEPSSVLWLCRELYAHAPTAYCLAIAGTTWSLHEGLSSEAQDNLAKALAFFNEWRSWNHSLVQE